ncbi:ribonuclease III [Chloroflexota bacterium]
MANLAALQDILGVSFDDLSLLEQALVHSSYVNENPDLVSASNERLEFLGDAILGLIIAEKLYQDFPEMDEGDMTKLRAALVRRETLARVAEVVGLGDYLYLGKGEEASGGRHRLVNLAGAFEAVIAAIFIDRSLAVTRDFVQRLFAEEIKKLISLSTAVDYKSQLQEFVQSSRQLTPVYRLVEATGPDHDRRFTVEVIAGDTVLGRGSGKSKKLAEIEAARLAWKQLSNDFTQ